MRRFFAPEVVQTSSMDCGPAALKSLCEGFGIRISYGRLREACQTDVDGTSIDTIEAVANQLGLDAAQTMLPVDHLLLSNAAVFPALIVVRASSGLTHFVILWRRVGGWVQVMDPAAGRNWVRATRFLETVFEHTQPLPAATWREWAGGDDHRKMLMERLRSAGVGRSAAAALIDEAVKDPGWRGLACLDAAIRLADKLIKSGAVSRRRAASMVRAFLDAPDQIPRQAWAVAPQPREEGGEEMIGLRGAVFVHTSGRKEEGAAADLSPELIAALREKPASAARAIFSLLRETGLGSPIAIFGAMVLAGCGTLLEGLLFRGLFDLARELPLSGQRFAAFGAVLLLLVALLLVEAPAVFGVLRLGRHMEMRLRAKFLAKLPRLGDRYFQSRPKSDMADRGHSLQQLRHLPEFASRLSRASTELLLTAAGVLWLDPGSAPLLAAFLAVAFLIPWLARPMLIDRDMRLRTHLGALSRFYLDALLGLFPIRAHGAQPAIRTAHRSLMAEWADAALRFQQTSVAVDGIQMLASYGMAALIILDYFRRSGEAGAGLLIVYWVLNMPALAQSVAQGFAQYPAFRNVVLRLMEPLGAIEEPLPEESGRASAGPMSIRLEQVSVRAGGHTILEDFDLDIPSGSHVAIVGPSGAGKSSFVGLLLGWHRPASGKVIVDGEELRGGAGAELRRDIAWVDPEVHLWNASCLDNLSYGAKPGEASAIGGIVERSELTEVLGKLPEGLQTKLGEGGAALSGGQGQRVRLGRAMLRAGARLVILDEAFRGLDHDRRLRLQTAVREHWRGSTMLCITHDVESTRDWDRVIVIERGRVVEDGRPAELAARADSRYRALLDAEHEVSGGLWSGSGWRHVRIAEGRVQ